MRKINVGKIRAWFILLALGLACMPSVSANAKTLYVDTVAGNDAISYLDNDSSRPWKTIGRAARGSTNYFSPNASQAARAGDLVMIAAGVYWENGNDVNGGRWSIALNPANSGTSVSPITFRGVGNVEIRLNNGVRGPSIGADARDYIIWDHFIIDDYYGGSAYDTGPVVFHVSTGSQLLNSDVRGHTGSYYWGYATFINNYPLVRLESTDRSIIRSNRVHRAHNHATGVGNQNTACIQTYITNYAIIEHNEVYDCGAGIFIKGIYGGATQTENRVRYNLVYECDHSGIIVSDASTTWVYQNIVLNSQRGMYIYGRPGIEENHNPYVVNNTIVGNVEGIVAFHGIIDGHVKNNIVTGGTHAQFAPCTLYPNANNVTFDRNLYYGYRGPFGEVECGTTYLFATWQGTYTKDPNGVDGSDPLFVATGSAPTYYKLQAGSPALTLGRVVESIGGTNGATIPVGVYITGEEVIGLIAGSQGGSSGGSSDSIPPLPVQNLRIVVP